MNLMSSTSNLQVFLSIFLITAIAELPDKTALATILMAAQYQPVGVAVGACAAFAFQSAVAVMAGYLFKYLPHTWVHLGVGILFCIAIADGQSVCLK